MFHEKTFYIFKFPNLMNHIVNLDRHDEIGVVDWLKRKRMKINNGKKVKNVELQYSSFNCLNNIKRKVLSVIV
jgi:hypothetical protein